MSSEEIMNGYCVEIHKDNKITMIPTYITNLKTKAIKSGNGTDIKCVVDTDKIKKADPWLQVGDLIIGNKNSKGMIEYSAYSNEKVEDNLARIERLYNAGIYVKYVGRAAFNDCEIQLFADRYGHLYNVKLKKKYKYNQTYLMRIDWTDRVNEDNKLDIYYDEYNKMFGYRDSRYEVLGIEEIDKDSVPMGVNCLYQNEPSTIFDNNYNFEDFIEFIDIIRRKDENFQDLQTINTEKYIYFSDGSNNELEEFSNLSCFSTGNFKYLPIDNKKKLIKEELSQLNEKLGKLK